MGYDLTVIGFINHADGIGRMTIGCIDTLKDDVTINYIGTHPTKTNDVSADVLSIASNPDRTPGTVSILFNPLWYSQRSKNSYEQVPNSPIKIAYSMLEGSEIPDKWVEILNQSFDAVAVPDIFLVDVYKKCGVIIPIFELPLGMFLDDFYEKEERSRPSKPFVFGTTVSCFEHKNYLLLISSFFEEFGNSDEAILKLNARFGNVKECKKLIKSLNASNILFTDDTLNQRQFVDFLNSFDCFVNISKGEGFSLCPREALALGIPCILSNNTAQTTLCKTGFVKEVPSNIEVPATYSGMFGKNTTVGVQFDSKKEDVKAALRDVYNNYDVYLEKAKLGKEWVFRYRWSELKARYLNLVKPQQILLGDKNEVTDTYFMTNSIQLYNKYTKIFDSKQ